MHYPEDYDVAQSHATTSIAHLKKRHLPWNPHNFTLWYEYVAGQNSELKKMMDAIIASGEQLSAERLAALYDEFFESPDLTVQTHEWSEKIEAAAGHIIDAISNVGKDTESYGAALKSFSGNIEGATNVDDIRALVTGILSETKVMDTQIHTLETRVKDASEEIEALKQNLESARRDALTDGLTGIANRKCFDQTLEQAIRRAEEEAEPLSLIITDLDHFKSFNDTHGHQVGDQVLRVVGATLKQCVKGQDTPARYGGEEFAVVLPNTTVGGACTVGEGIRKAIASKKLVRKGTDKEIASISVSVGVTEYFPGESIPEFIKRADEALYRAKELGRNRVISDTRELEPA